MKSLFLLVCLLLFIPVSSAQMAIGPPRIESIDAKLIKFHTIGVGTIVQVNTATAKQPLSITVAVKEDFRKNAPAQIELRVKEPLASLQKWSADQNRILFFDAAPQAESSKPFAQLIDLDSKKLLESDEDFRVYRETEPLLAYIRKSIQREPEMPPYSISFISPINGGAGDTWRRAYEKFAELEVPNDSHLEAKAKQLLVSRSSEERRNGANELRYMKSDGNVRLLRRCLDDRGIAIFTDASINLGVEKDDYIVRHTAYDILMQWGEQVPQPVLQIDIPRFKTLKKLYLYDAKQGQEFAILRKMPALEELTVSEPNVSPFDLAMISDTRSLRSLTLPPNCLDDNRLSLLSNLPRLETLKIDGNSITDAGAEKLLTFPKLKSVSLAETEVTKREFEKLRKERAGLTITPVDPISPIFNYIRKDDLDGVKRVLDLFPDSINQHTNPQYGSTPLFEAAYQSHYDIAKLFLDHGADMESVNGLHETPLFAAIHESSPDGRILLLLLSRGASTAAQDYQHFSVLDEAMYTWQSKQAIRLLVNTGAPTNPDHWPKKIDNDYRQIAESFEDQKRRAPFLVKQSTADCPKTIYVLSDKDDLNDKFSTQAAGRLTGQLQWSKSPTGRAFIGPLGQQALRLNLHNLLEHGNVHIDIELFIIGSWDGNGGLGAGPDLIDISVPNVGALMHSTFFNNTEGDLKGLPMQSFPDEYPFGFHPGHTGAGEFNSLGFQDTWQGDTNKRDAVYHLSFNIVHSGKDFELVITGNNIDQGVANLIDDENWGIASLVVKTD